MRQIQGFLGFAVGVGENVLGLGADVGVHFLGLGTGLGVGIDKDNLVDIFSSCFVVILS